MIILGNILNSSDILVATGEGIRIRFIEMC